MNIAGPVLRVMIGVTWKSTNCESCIETLELGFGCGELFVHDLFPEAAERGVGSEVLGEFVRRFDYDFRFDF